jgi:cytochrome c peroxidase
MWNIYLNPDLPEPSGESHFRRVRQRRELCRRSGISHHDRQFKTPTLRDLKDSAPYFHNGRKLLFGNVVQFYIDRSRLARQGQLPNAPVKFQSMSVSQADIAALVAFLQSLTEDYDDA